MASDVSCRLGLRAVAMPGDERGFPKKLLPRSWSPVCSKMSAGWTGALPKPTNPAVYRLETRCDSSCAIVNIGGSLKRGKRCLAVSVDFWAGFHDVPRDTFELVFGLLTVIAWSEEVTSMLHSVCVRMCVCVVLAAPWVAFASCNFCFGSQLDWNGNF